jgi:hypothetical protein
VISRAKFNKQHVSEEEEEEEMSSDDCSEQPVSTILAKKRLLSEDRERERGGTKKSRGGGETSEAKTKRGRPAKSGTPLSRSDALKKQTAVAPAMVLSSNDKVCEFVCSLSIVLFTGELYH